jgi:uncharacterized protein
MSKIFGFIFCLISFCFKGSAQSETDSAFIVNNFTKMERMIPMRDGIKLFTAIYIPKDQNEKYPFLMERTPYSCGPYGENRYRTRGMGPNSFLLHEKYIFVYQDVRGRYKSEGEFQEMTPAKDVKKTKKDTDESSDTFDTIEWLLKNIKNNNGRVGLYGISYPGFYASAALPDAHPAIRAVSPQAPVTDEFIGDDAYHNGAFFLLDNFDFTNYFQGTRTDSGKSYKDVFEMNRSDAYAFFLALGSIKHTNDPRYFGGKAKIWNEYLGHDTYDAYWRERNIRTHLKNVRPAVLVVGGWFDAEDMFGALHTYEAIEEQSPHNHNVIVMGPWTHGAWSAPEWSHFGTHNFGSNINDYYQKEIESKFFNFYLKEKGSGDLSEATIFETGTNQWKHYATWPPADPDLKTFYLSKHGRLTNVASEGFDEYISDPAKPVPYTAGTYADRNNEYLAEDQRFVAERPDVLVFVGDTLQQDMQVTGKLRADIFFSSTGTDLDLIVKLIDVLPAAEEKGAYNPQKQEISGFQRLVRAEVFRTKFRSSYEKPQPLVPGRTTEVKFDLNAIGHTFKKGHRIMVQVQSSWFPIVDRNPQKFVDIPSCADTDFQKATIRLFHNSSLTLPVNR